MTLSSYKVKWNILNEIGLSNLYAESGARKGWCNLFLKEVCRYRKEIGILLIGRRSFMLSACKEQAGKRMYRSTDCHCLILKVLNFI